MSDFFFDITIWRMANAETALAFIFPEAPISEKSTPVRVWSCSVCPCLFCKTTSGKSYIHCLLGRARAVLVARFTKIAFPFHSFVRMKMPRGTELKLNDRGERRKKETPIILFWLSCESSRNKNARKEDKVENGSTRGAQKRQKKEIRQKRAGSGGKVRYFCERSLGWAGWHRGAWLA